MIVDSSELTSQEGETIGSANFSFPLEVIYWLGSLLLYREASVTFLIEISK
jgi:hypothetical protein